MLDEAPEDERDIELSSIAAIFPELCLDPHNQHYASLELEVSPSEPLRVQFTKLLNQDKRSHEPLDTPTDPILASQIPLQATALKHLPPLILNIDLPEGYPDTQPPFFKLSTSVSWISQDRLLRLVEFGASLWEEYGHSQIVFAYIDMLQQEAEQAFSLPKNAGGYVELDVALQEDMLAFDSSKQRALFEQGHYDCGVCLEPKKGSLCYRLKECGHVFCIECLQDFYNSAITEGDVASVKCVAPDCGMEGLNLEQRRAKRQKTLHPRELLDIPISLEQVQRYADLKVKKMLESDKTTIYCPRSWCQAPARSLKYAKYNTRDLLNFPDSDDEEALEPAQGIAPGRLNGGRLLNRANGNAAEESDGEEGLVAANGNGANAGTDAANLPRKPLARDRLAICSKCEYAFCWSCEKSWHGDFVHCLPKPPSELAAEDQASYDFIRLHTSLCPTCDCPVQKTHGCNHMRCFQCNTHFCYLCSSWLDARDPYKHFNTLKSPCHMRLWDLEGGDEGADGEAGNIQFGGARGAEIANFQPRDGAAVPAAAPQVQRAPPAGQPDRGLQRFLMMAANDEEDGWDSDELDEDFAEQLVLFDH